ncbi:MAG: DUF4349 domain-containing protein, partial [Acidobacteria bacterium]|nr:DUF4349 domain-containing protein [Acidobacteriota bacterium]
MKRLSLAALILASLFFSACGSAGVGSSADRLGSVSSESEPENASAANTAPASVADQARKTGGGGGGGTQPLQENIPVDQASASQQTLVPADRKIIRNAELDLESEAPDEAQTRITAIAEQMGGFVVESQQSSS